MELYHRMRGRRVVNIDTWGQFAGTACRRTGEEVEQVIRLSLERSSAPDKAICAHSTR
jgi:hypothetical protein